MAVSENNMVPVSSGVEGRGERTWRDLFPLPWSRLLPSCSWIKAANGEHALDVRGWSYLTGTGGGLKMSGHEATDIQAAIADEVVRRINAHDKLVEALKAARDGLNDLGEHLTRRANMMGILKVSVLVADCDAALALALAQPTPETEGR